MCTLHKKNVDPTKLEISRKNTPGTFLGSIGKNSVFSVQGAQVPSLARELDPTGCNSEPVCHSQDPEQTKKYINIFLKNYIE